MLFVMIPNADRHLYIGLRFEKSRIFTAENIFLTVSPTWFQVECRRRLMTKNFDCLHNDCLGFPGHQPMLPKVDTKKNYWPLWKRNSFDVVTLLLSSLDVSENLGSCEI